VRIDGEGSGLGLSIVDAVMKAHGGNVSVTSELGKGATFTLFFPQKTEEEI
jgi:two-component system OmpR family sensor kinase